MADTAANTLSQTAKARQAGFAVSEDSLEAYARDRLKAAEAYPRDRLIKRCFHLARLDMTVWFTSAQLAELCEKSFVARRIDDATATRLEVHAIDAEAAGWEYPAIWSEAGGFSSRGFERTLDAGNLRGFYDHDAPSWQFYDRARAIGVHSLPNQLGIPPWEHGSPFRLFLHWAYAAAGRRLTHAATLGLDGRGALIVGPSGSGKSGTTLGGLLNGLTSAGDDYVLLEEGPAITAHAVFRVFKQDREGLRRAGVADETFADADLNWHGKIEFDAAKLAPTGFVDRMNIDAILIPEIARLQSTAIERVPAHEAALALAPSAVFQLPGDTAGGFRFFADIARRLPAFRLKLSEDPAEISAAIGSFLAREKPHSD
jgi:hypothetical protein